MKKEIIKYVTVFFSLILIFVGYSTLVCSLPTGGIKKNIEKDASKMAHEGDYPFAIINKKQYRMDNYTDALILNINYTIDNKKPLKAAMSAELNDFYGENATGCLQKLTNREECSWTIKYARYWHGNAFLLRLFLFFMDYSTIRWMLYLLSNVLILILSVKLYQTLGMRKTMAFVTGLLCVNIFVTQFSIQSFAVVNLAVIASILMCVYSKNKEKILLISFIIGCLTSYFDILTTPLLTCGLPLIVYLSIENDDSLKDRFRSLILFGFLWAVGYFLTWASKWVLGTIFTDVNVLENAFNQVLKWSNNEDLSRFDAIIDNFNLLPKFFIFMILALFLPLVVIFFNKKAIKTNLLLLIVATLPYLWLIAIAKHSLVHAWFTYRIQVISIVAVFFIFINFVSWDKLKHSNRKKHSDRE